MRKIQLTVAILLSVCRLSAQTENILAQLQIVGKPEKSTTEIVGVKDASGRFCAAIQVLSDMEGYSYQSYNGVVRMDDKPGKDMVYVSPDERVLEILHSGFEPLKVILSEYGIQLNEKEVWVIKISGEKKIEQIMIAVISTPAGAEISLDGENRGAVKQFSATTGSHQLRLSKPGFQPVIETIFVDPQKTLFEYALKQQEDVNIQVITQPAGAAVSLENVNLGITPVNTFYPAGRYKLRIEKEWYVTYEDVVDIQPGMPRIAINLQEDYGRLSVASTPESGLDILLDGKSQQVQTPHVFERLRPGQYLVQAHSSLYETEVKSVEIKRGDKLEISLTTVPSFATLTIRTRENAAVYLDGKRITQLKEIRLPPSVVVVRVEMPKAVPLEKRVVLRKNESQALDLYPSVPTGTIQVAPVPFDAKVELRGDAGEFYTSEGSHIFSDIPAGSYSLSVGAPGFVSSRETMVLKEGEKITRQVALIEGRSSPNEKRPLLAIGGFSRSAVFFESAVLPGLGQVTHGRKTGWLYMVGLAAGGGYYIQQMGAHNTNVDEYNRLNGIYKNSYTAANMGVVASAYEKVKSSYKTCNVVLGVVVGIYAVNLLDALLFKPKIAETFSSPRMHISPDFSVLVGNRSFPSLRIEVGL